MKKILLILALCGLAGTASAQFPTQDSLVKFINKWIRNSAVDAFTNLRLNTALLGMVAYADSAGIKKVEVSGTTLRIITVGKDTFAVILPGGGGGGTLSNVGSGFRVAVAGTANVKTLFAGLGLILDSTANTNALTFKMDTAGIALYFLRKAPPGSTTQVIFNDGGVYGADAGLTYNKTTNELTTDSTSTIQHRADYVTLNAIQVVDSVRGVGNSIISGSNASPPDSGFLRRIGAFLEKPVANYGIPGRGSVTAISQHYLYTPLLHFDMSVVMVGFNDIRRNNVQGTDGYKTLNKIINAHKSIFLNHFLKSFYPAGSGSVTRYGSWTAPWDARAEAGKTGSGAFTSVKNDSLVYAFTDSTVGIGMIGGNAEGANYSVYVDNVLKASGASYGQYDGSSDGFAGNTRAPFCVIITGLTNAAHTLKIVNNSDSLLILDYVGHLRDAATAPPMVIFHAPYMDATGYATSPNASNVARTNLMNSKLDSLITAFPVAYQSKVVRVPTNSTYDTTTGLDPSDHIHPNNTGHRQIYNGFAAAASTDNKPLGSIYFANGNFYGVTAGGATRLMQGTGVASYIPKFSGLNSLTTSLIQDDGTNVGIGQTPGTYKLSITGAVRATTDGFFGGNVGIGTTSPSYKLDVNGQVGASGTFNSNGLSSGFAMTDRNTGAAAWSIYAGLPSLNFYSTPNTIERVKMWARSGVTIGHATEANMSDENRGLAVHGSVAIEKDSVPTVTSTAGMFVLVQDTTATADSNRIKKMPFSSLPTGTPALTTNQIGVGASNLLSGSSAFTNDGTTVRQEVSGAKYSAINTASLGSTGGGSFNGFAKLLPTAADQQLAFHGGGTMNNSTTETVTGGWGIFSTGAFTFGSSHQTNMRGYVTTTTGLAEVIRLTANQRVGIRTAIPGASLHLPAGASSAGGAPLMFTSGTDLSSPVAGAWYYDGTRLGFSPSTTIKRIPLTNDVVGTLGYMAVGDGTNYTVGDIFPIVSVSTTGTTTLAATAKMTTIKADATGGNVTITITPSHTGQIFNVKRMDGSVNTLTIQMTSGTIDGASTKTLVTQYSSLQIQWDGTNAIIL